MSMDADVQSYLRVLIARAPQTATELAEAHGHSREQAKRRLALARSAGLVMAAGPRGARAGYLPTAFARVVGR